MTSHIVVLFSFLSQKTRDSIDHYNSISLSTQTTPVYLVTSLSCLVFVTDHTRQVDHDCLVSFSMQTVLIPSVTSLSYWFSSHIAPKVLIVQVDFSLEQTYTIDHVVVLSSFHHKPYPIQLVIIDQFHFQYKPYLYDQSRSFPIRFSSQSTPNSIGHKVQYCFHIDYTYMIGHVVVLFRFRHRWHLI